MAICSFCNQDNSCVESEIDPSKRICTDCIQHLQSTIYGLPPGAYKYNPPNKAEEPSDGT